MREINPNIYPPEGRKFTERDGSVFRASSWERLKRKVIEYRERNGFSVGDVWAEIMTQICGASPGLCGETGGENRHADSSGMSYNARINEWMAWALSRKRLQAIQRVNAEETARRAAICATCPKQLSLTESCGACIVAIKAARSAMLDGAEPPFQNLHPCSVLKEDVVTSVSFTLSPSNNPELPAHCWRRA